MPRRTGGLDSGAIDDALAALSAVGSLAELEAALDRVPALHAPVLHSILRHQYLELRNAGSPLLVNFEPRYQDLFMLLHERLHERLVSRARADGAPSSEAPGGTAAPDVFAPPYWLALRDALADALPADRGAPRDPATDAAAIRDDLRACTTRDVALPEYVATAGTRWTAVTVGCASCGRRRLDLRAYVADLVVAPELSAPLRAGRINNSSCAGCGQALSHPIRVWVMESPGSGDPLAALSCVWRLAPDVMAYQPPPGTPRVEANDHILEVRFDRLRRTVRWPEPEESAAEGAVVETISVAYSVDELIRSLDRVTPASDALPLAMQTMIGELTRKVESGVLPLHQAMEAVDERVRLAGQDWPLVHPGIPRLFEGPPLAHLFHSLTLEGVARARSLGADARAMYACTTASSLLAMGEGALAEAALARAEDHLARASPGRARDLAAMAVSDTRADVFEFLGRREEAAAVREELARAPELEGDDWGRRFARQGLASQDALACYQRDEIASALEGFQRVIPAWEALRGEAHGARTPDADQRVRSVDQALSGALANLAAVFMTLSEDLAVLEVEGLEDLPPAEARDRLRSVHPDPARAVARLQPAFPALERYFGGGVTRSGLVDAADELLRRALALSEAADAWEFAGVQAHRLAVLRREGGRPDEAEEFAERAIRHAARAGDHERIWTAQAFLAERALERGDGPAALEHLEACARDRIRQEIGLGHHAELASVTEILGDGAFRAVAAGGDALRAVVIVESLRAASTAASIVAGTPLQPGGGGVPEAISRLAAEREQLRLHLTWQPDAAEARARLDEVEAALDAERRRLAVRDPRYGRWVDATDVDVAPPDALPRRLAPLGSRSFWLGALVAGDRVWSYAAGRDPAVVRSAPVPDAAGLLAGDVAADGAVWTEAALTGIAEALLAPHATRIEALAPGDTVVISVPGAWHRIPFAALPWAGKRLCERAALVVVQGFGMFEAASDRPRLALNAFALVGAPKRPDLDALPGSLEELRSVARILEESGRHVETFPGVRATPAALGRAATSHDAIHISCHAVADPSPARASRLMLSPDLVRGDSGDLSEDRIIGEMDVRPGALVNLAGCATARTRESRAPLLGGLVPAFLLAGASSVIASLWPIEDRSAAVMQAEIYRGIARGARPAAALAEAQRRCLRGELGPDPARPATWAAYAAYGAV